MRQPPQTDPGFLPGRGLSGLLLSLLAQSNPRSHPPPSSPMTPCPVDPPCPPSPSPSLSTLPLSSPVPLSTQMALSWPFSRGLCLVAVSQAPVTGCHGTWLVTEGTRDLVRGQPAVSFSKRALRLHFPLLPINVSWPRLVMASLCHCWGGTEPKRQQLRCLQKGMGWYFPRCF